MHRDTPNNETVIVEYGFIDSPSDAQQIKDNYKEYAEAVVRAVADYKNIKYVPPAGSNYYIVKKGDTLYDIAKEYKTTVSELKKLNNLNTDKLTINQQLKIPGNKTLDEINYTVKKGDNLYTIANKYDTTVNEIKKINNLSSNVLKIGQVLKLPNLNKIITYTVKKGDSLWKIANKYNTTVKKIITLNNLSTSTLQIGQTLLIPSN